jgi:hypothetical protein
MFLLWLTLETRRAGMQVIKGSSVATLIALDRQTRAHLGGMYDLNEANKVAGKINVRLQRDVSGVGISLGMMRR